MSTTTRLDHEISRQLQSVSDELVEKLVTAYAKVIGLDDTELSQFLDKFDAGKLADDLAKTASEQIHAAIYKSRFAYNII